MDQENKFLDEFKTMIQADYGIIAKPITSRNPHNNFILERVHEVKCNIIRTFKLQNMVLSDENPWDRASNMFALCATVHNMTQLTSV